MQNITRYDGGIHAIPIGTKSNSLFFVKTLPHSRDETTRLLRDSTRESSLVFPASPRHLQQGTNSDQRGQGSGQGTSPLFPIDWRFPRHTGSCGLDCNQHPPADQLFNQAQNVRLDFPRRGLGTRRTARKRCLGGGADHPACPSGLARGIEGEELILQVGDAGY